MGGHRTGDVTSALRTAGAHQARARWIGAVVALLVSTIGFLVGASPTTASAEPLPFDPTKAIATGGVMFTCGITEARGVRCWGANDALEMGQGFQNYGFATPIDIPGVTDVVAVTAAWRHACALTATGKVWCWGFDWPGHGLEYAASPVVPTGLASGVVSIEAGGKATCAVKDDGTVWCWGYGLRKVSGSFVTDTTPVQVPGLSGITTVSIDDSTSPYFEATACAASSTGVWCWGGGTYGQLGNGSATSSQTPVAVSGIGGVRSLSAGAYASCAVSTSGALSCWGNGDQNGTGTSTNVPTPVFLGGKARSVMVGGTSVCAVTTSSKLFCWGRPNDLGFGGDATLPYSPPHEITNIGGSVVAADTIRDHTCAILTDGTGRCWTDGNYRWNGALGIADWTGAYRSPHVVDGLTSGVAEAAAGQTFACIRTTAGDGLCAGVLAPTISVRTTTYSAVSGLGTIRAIRAGSDFACAISTADAVSCWGGNAVGQLGNGTTTASAAPVPVSGLSSGVVDLDLGGQTACALLTGGSVKCWGANNYGQLGNNTTTASSTPVQVSGLTSGATSISAGPHSCAGTSSGVKCWGSNASGELGNNSTTNSKVPVAVTPTVNGTPTVSAAGTCSTDGTSVRCWGANDQGQIGNGTTTGSKVPVLLTSSNLPSSIASVTAAAKTVCALGTDGTQACWGNNEYGTVGNDAAIWYSPTTSPVAISGGMSSLSGDPSASQFCGTTTAAALSCWGLADEGHHGFARWRPHTVDGGAQFAHELPPPPAMPTITAERSPLPNAAGWNNVPVTVTFDCNGGAAPLSCPSSQTFGEGADQTASGTVTDGEGQEATATVTDIDVDLTAPSGSGTVTTPLPVSGWYTGDVAVAWSCADALSGVETCPSTGTVTGEGAAAHATATVTDRAGNTGALTSPDVAIDRTAPVTSTSAAAWTATSTVVHLDPSDNLSGVAATSWSLDGGPSTQGTDVTVTGEGSHTIDFRSTDVAGNVESLRTVTIGIDGNAPTITATSTPEPNEAGWNKTDATVTFTCGDDRSGIASCTAPTTVATDGTTVVTGTATDRAGNAATTSATVHVDETAPTITKTVPAPGAGGWRRTPVTITWNCSDATSGIASCTPPTTIAADGVGLSATGTAVDAAGNTSSISATGIKIDQTGPIVEAAVTPAPDANGVRTGPVTVRFACTDVTSGMNTCPEDQVLTDPGTHTVSVTASDRAGNTTSTSVSVVVDAAEVCSCVTVTADVDPAAKGQNVVLTARTTLGTTGTMTFYDGATSLGTKTVAGGTASLVTSKLAIGSHTITVSWKRTSTSTPVVSAPWFQLIGRAVTTAAVSSSANPSVWGQAVTVKATIKGVGASVGTPAGRIEIYDGDTLVASGTSTTGILSVSIKPTIGTHRWRAAYAGSSTHAPSSSTELVQATTRAATRVALSGSTTIMTTARAAITGAVTTISPGTGVPTGTITFRRDGVDVLTVDLASGKAKWWVGNGATPKGTFELTATYSGDATHAPSASTAPLVVTFT